ncbi:hypothetical protein [Legionella cardiaca]|uniref:Uncharacterized protein n=1 Tax=Legionella cardiaca TaxID=1071983 RepID=A0ABY8AWP2_9GAMM|nr:hypothetical protein [Legionella cardiaca]WED43552.1 hypothetical protein PXX05_01900 [Legionella cardiaca]
MRVKEKITIYRVQYNQFIDEMRCFFDKTEEPIEKAHRHEVFDTLLLLATYSTAAKFDAELHNLLPLEENNLRLKSMCQRLQELNGVCTCTLSDEHEIYQELFNGVSFLNFDKKDILRHRLSQQITELILEKTNTHSVSLKNY